MMSIFKLSQKRWTMGSNGIFGRRQSDRRCDRDMHGGKPNRCCLQGMFISLRGMLICLLLEAIIILSLQVRHFILKYFSMFSFFTNEMWFIVISNQIMSCWVWMGQLKLLISAFVPKSPMNRIRGKLWLAHPIGWHQKVSSHHIRWVFAY